MTAGYRWLLKAARLVHLVTSMLGLMVLLFFGLTGLILNHPEWLSQEELQQNTATGSLPSRLLKRPLDKLLVVEYLRSEYGITAPLASYEDDGPEQVRLMFKAPGREVHVEIERKKEQERKGDDAAKEVDQQPEEGEGSEKKEGDLTVTYQTYNLAGRLADLHRGRASLRDPGPVWSLVIDSASVLVVCLGLTGLVLWMSLKTRRWLGLGALALGTGALLGVYFWLVP